MVEINLSTCIEVDHEVDVHLCVSIPNRHVVHKDFDIRTMLIICVMPFNNNQCVFDVLFADKTSQTYVSLSGPISLSDSGDNRKVGIILTDGSTRIIKMVGT